MKGNHTTLKDIAQQLGITVATVSRALKDYPDISPDTKEAVLTLAKELKYRPNPIALNLRSNRSHIIGVIIPEIVHYFFSTVISGIMEVADQAGYTVMLCQTNETYEREVREAGVLLNSRVDGLLVSLSDNTQTYAHLQEFMDYDIPLVLFDRVCDQLNVSKVIVDDYDGAYKAVEHIIQQDYQRIALIRGVNTTSITQARLAGYLDALRTYNIPIQDEYICECTHGLTFEEGARLARHLMQLPSPPDAIFAVADAIAIGALMTVREMGLQVPQDLAIVGFSNWEMSAVVTPPLTSVNQPGFEMGQTATRILLEQIELIQNKKLIVPTTHLLKTSLIVRGSSVRVPVHNL